ncbi:uncharacterized protein PHACADRAFT_191130 [Phanerochaete carnosa HHB-10118-sp]|uniref:Uncharacterized protein n=1 Tax=Phanerochaete carnosa (strain HHB-10118-sp) TaxID=650164 RepID=K5W4J6_PHACS|nr:uncharacterized protein PHACADRAFT_191130 [Phanerochaete carnosa HHB-10118-sp]EKM58798.1 hypothetical protein PHACADRAFT_191130 [Phanerochaete carnosa HHB-10118-sp]
MACGGLQLGLGFCKPKPGEAKPKPPASGPSRASQITSHALWYPEPHESGEPQIGDAGFVHEGAFIRLFNLDTSTSEKEVKFWEPPFEIIEPLPRGVLKIDRRQRPLVPDQYCSHGVESRQMTAGANVTATLTAKYTCKVAQGAILELKSDAVAETLFENQALEKYIVRNHDIWYGYATDTLGH